jgi:aminopeptidase N
MACDTIGVMTNVKRLLSEYKPKSYEIKFDLDDTKMEFSGSVKIQGTKTSTSKTISLHSKELDIISAKINGAEAKTSTAAQDELIIESPSEINQGDCEIEINFNGRITETMHGIYVAPYVDEEGNNRPIIATQFESHHAREAFPCIDEPMAKAVFNLTLVHNKQSVALSNMPIKNARSSDQKQVTSYETTPIMSTYLLAFVVGDYVKVGTKSKRGAEVNVWSTPSLADHLEFALETGKRGLDFFEDYFGIDYPLPKCDLVAVPSFSAGAMENWGLITFRESALIVDEKNTKLGTKQRVAETIIHELAHQWFGNLVTMEWWSDLWLNEGFASWAANFGVDNLFPEWNYWAQFISSDFSLTQSADSLPSSRPIEVEISDPDEIRSIFDEISYSKGPVIVRMLHEYLGDENFQDGISHYLRKFSYSNATTNDLWSALQEASNKPVGEFMSAWTSQAGYPFVKVTEKQDGVELTQERFLITGSDKEKIWPLPMTHTNSDETFLFDSQKAIWKTDLSGHPKINKGQGGLYIVSYEKEHLESLKNSVIEQSISEVERLGIIEDMLLLAKSGNGSLTDLVDLIFKLGQEESLVVWDAISGVLGSIKRTMDDDAVIESMRPKSKVLAQHNLERLGWDMHPNESSFDTLMRPMILGLAAFGDNQSVIDRAIEMFDSASKPEDIQPNLRGVAYGCAVRFGDMNTFDKLLEFYRNTDSPQEKQALAGALTSFKQPEIIERCLELIKSEVKLQDTGFWFAYSFTNRHAKELMWDWVKQNWDWILSKFSEDLMTLSWIPEYSAAVFSTHEFMNDYKEFWKMNSRKSLEREINKGIETLTWQIAWRDRDFEKISEYFSKN